MIELDKLIEEYDIGRFSNTKTRVLRDYLIGCLDTYEIVISQRGKVDV